MFNPDYVEVDRVLEVSFCEDNDTGEVDLKIFHTFEIEQRFYILELNLDLMLCVFHLFSLLFII